MQDTAFKKLYGRLNLEQKKAVDTIDGPVMVIAGPGTGKTTILTLRIANILRRTDTPPSGILVLTYTDAGVKAIREKLYAIIGNRAHDVFIHTFHSFAASVISEYPDHFLKIDRSRIMTEVEQLSIVSSILSDRCFAKLRPAARPDAYVHQIVKTIENAKREALLPEDVRKFALDEAERIKDDKSSFSVRGATKGKLKAEALEFIEKCQKTVLFSDAYKSYEAKKRELELLDYGDLIIELLVALKNDQLLLRLIQERFLYVLIDEHQDTNDAQNYIVAMIAEFFETPNLFIVGDEKQAIYRFQGASVENFLMLRKRYPKMKLVSLDKNYRSHQRILDAAFKMIEENYEEGEHKDLRVRLKSVSASGSKPVEIATGEDVAATESFLVKRLKEIAKGDPTATVAVIVRRNRELDRVIDLLESEGVAVSSERSVNIFNHPIGALFFDLLDYLSDPTRVDALAKTIIARMWNISFASGIQIIKGLKSGSVSDVESAIPALAEIKKGFLNDSPVGFIIKAGELSGFVGLLSGEPAYVNVWRGIVSLAETLARDGDIKRPDELLKSMLSYRYSAEFRSVKVSVGGPEERFKAMTAHASKGLEFDYIFLPYANEETWVGRPRGSSFVLPKKQASESDIRDTRRLFYVALTRARKHAVIIVPKEESDGKKLAPLRFISELDKEHVSFQILRRADYSRLSKRENFTGDQSFSLKLVAVAKNMLLENGLSVTALNHFLKCPNEFLYQSVLKMPQAPAVAAEKGNAMHFAVSEVWESRKSDVKTVGKLLGSKIEKFLERSELASSEKEALGRELMEVVPVVALALSSHFRTYAGAEVFTEYSVKSFFEAKFGNKTVRFPIHGKLDALIANGDQVNVFDYKTRQAMSVQAIKGETKNDSGDYFRQLAFYKLLLSGSPKWSSKIITPALVFVSPDKKGRCPTVPFVITERDMERVKSEIRSLADAVWSGRFLDEGCGDKKCPYCRLRKVVK